MRTLATTIILAIFIATLGACQTLQTSPAGGGTPPPQKAKGPIVEEKKPKETYDRVNKYTEFDDILIPHELEMETDEYYVFETSQFKTGIMLFAGRVDSLSLFEFFINNMVKDGWQKQNTFKASRSILVFEKPSKNCIIQIDDNSFTTSVMILAVEQKSTAPLQPSPRPAQPQIIDEQNLPK